MTKKVYKIEKWIKEKIACWCNESQCEVPELPKQIIEGKILALREMLSFIDSLQEEPVSEDLSEYINELSKQFPEVSFAKLSRIAVRVAKWQKAQFEKNRLKHCNSITNEQAELEQGFIDQHIDKYNRMPTFLDAIEYGMRLQKEKMMENTTDTMVGLPYENKDGGYTHLIDVSRPLPVGNNKITIIFKED